MLSEQAARQLRVGQSAVMAMCSGVVILTGLFAYLATRGDEPSNPQLAIVFYVLLAALLVGVPALRIVAQRATVQRLRRRWAGHPPRPEDADIFVSRAFVQMTIIVAALAEGAALFGAVGLYLTGQWPLLVGSVYALLLLALVYPSRPKLSALMREVTGQDLT
ncbi:MAG: hypothetical protein IPM18_10555 [Phycisphaerales bacterium]|nr:hypothetical protein [Phycisphaerales bacterium]